MGKIYDDWEILVEAVLRREKLRELAMCHSRAPSSIEDGSSSSSSRRSFSSSFRNELSICDDFELEKALPFDDTKRTRKGRNFLKLLRLTDGKDRDSPRNGRKNFLFGYALPFGWASSSSYEALPRFWDVPISEKPQLFIKNVKMCGIALDYNDPDTNLRKQNIKKQTLLELINYVTLAKMKFTETETRAVVKMVSLNIFEDLSKNKLTGGFDLQDDRETAICLAWPDHLHIVYKLFLMFIDAPQTDNEVVQKYVDSSFIVNLLDLLIRSEDSREREHVKTALLHLYGKFIVYRPFIIRAVDQTVYCLVFETERRNGITDLLEVLGGTINEYVLPLKEKDKLILSRTLIPLHKPEFLHGYHKQLCYCIVQFVKKDSMLAEIVIAELIKCWPVNNSSKEILFLHEVEEVLQKTGAGISELYVTFFRSNFPVPEQSALSGC